METRYKIIAFVVLGITFVSTGFGMLYLSAGLQPDPRIPTAEKLEPDTNPKLIQDPIRLTPFDVYFAKNDFTIHGPNHGILALKPGESASLEIIVENNDSIPHEISFEMVGDFSNFPANFSFEPSTINVLPGKTKETSLKITIHDDSSRLSGLTDVLAYSSSFGAKGLAFYLEIDDDEEPDVSIDYALRFVGLPGPAFPPELKVVSRSDLQKTMSNGFGIPQYLPQGYELQAMVDHSDDETMLIYWDRPVSKDTDSIEFWNEGGMIVMYYSDSNMNPKRFLGYLAEHEGQQAKIIDLDAIVIDRQEKHVMDYDQTFFAAGRVLMISGNSEVQIKSNIQLDELLSVAVSITSPENNN